MNCNVASCIAAAITLAACRSELPPPDVQTVDVQTVDAAMRDVQIAVRDVPPLPDEPPVVHPERPQPAISGGTLLIASDGRIAVAADPDGDVIWFADLETRTRLGSLALQRGDEPGRIVQDASGRVHVVLRGGGAVVSIDPGSRTLIERRAVCAAPRGIAYEPTGDALLVACAGGELVTLPAAGGSATRTVLLGRDLRDVVVQGDRIYVTRFRAAEVITLRSNGDVIERTRPPVFTAPSTPGLSFAPGVAWRTIGLPDGGLLMLHQRSQVERVSTVRGYGGGACGSGIVHSAVTTFGPAGPLRTPVIMATVLPVDLALSPDGRELAIVSAGRGEARSADVQLVPRDQLASGSECARGSVLPADALGRTLAVAWSGNSLIVQTRGPATLRVLLPIAQTIVLDESVAEERGQALFHASTPSGLACASCHPEAGDDGHTWQFTAGPRRTQSMRGGGLLGTAPFHWSGDMPSFSHLMTQVFVGRMGGSTTSAEGSSALAGWIDVQRPVPSSPATDIASVERGRAIFNAPEVGCAGCHTGPQFTNNATVDVGTGAPFQVPSLVGIAWRAPFMHNGCAAILRDRFGAACGGGDAHGHTSQLLPDQVTDLVNYLESL